MSKPGVWEGVEGAAAEGSPIVPCRWQPLPPGFLVACTHCWLGGPAMSYLGASKTTLPPPQPTTVAPGNCSSQGHELIVRLWHGQAGLGGAGTVLSAMGH